MGKKRKGASLDLSVELSKVLVPADYLLHFVVVKVVNLPNEWQIVLHEKEDLLPSTLKGSLMPVLDGFCNPIHISSHAFSLKPVYLVIHRRRWKESNSDKHFSNEYSMTKDSAKITPQMGGFLKI